MSARRPSGHSGSENAVEDAELAALDSAVEEEIRGTQRTDDNTPDALSESPKEMETAAPESVAGERGIPSVNRAASLQSRVSNVLAIGLMASLGLGLLVWYYTRLWHETPKPSARANAGRVASDAPLPALGRIAPPAPASTSLAAELLGPAPDPPPEEDIPAAWLEPAVGPEDAAGAMPAAAANVKTPEQLMLERQLAGRVFSRATDSMGGGGVALDNPSVASNDPPAAARAPSSSALSEWLVPTATPAVRASLLPTERWLLPKGAFIDCTLETAIDTSVPGMTTCVAASDTFGVDGSIVLIERGTKLIGETRGEVRRGSARVFVLWSEARTPAGVVIPLGSPGTDELGRAGLPGAVQRHFWERFGAAILISVIEGAIDAASAEASGDRGTVVLNPSRSQDLLTEVLKSTLDIPPTVVKRHGDRIQILVARDVDFRSVYALELTRR